MFYYQNSNYNNDFRGAPFLLPFLTGALVASPFAFLAGTNKPQQNYSQPIYYYPPQYPIYYRR